MKIPLLFILFVIVSGNLWAQGIKNTILDVSDNGSLEAYLKEIESKNQFDFIYEEGIVNGLTIHGITKKIHLSSYLDQILAPFKLKAVRVRNNVIFIINETELWEYGKKKGNYLVVNSNGHQIIGKIKDGDTNEPIVGANINSWG